MEIEDIEKQKEKILIENAIKRIKKAGAKLTEDEIIGRKQQRDGIETNIKKFIQTPGVVLLFVNGTTGTGKTMLVTNLLNKYKESIEYFYSNAIQEPSIDSIVWKMYHHLSPNRTQIKLRKNAEPPYSLLTAALRRSEKRMIAVIDEYDVFMNSNSDKIYSFTDWIYSNQPPLMVIFISNQSQAASEMQTRIASRFQPINYDFMNYQKDEIKEIIITRIGKEIIDKIFDEKDFDHLLNTTLFETLNSGDVRKALGLMLNVLISAQERLENGLPLKLGKQQTGELTRSIHSVSRLATCSQFEVILLHCIMKSNESNRYDIKSIVECLDGIKMKKPDLINWNETILNSCFSRLEMKELITIQIKDGHTYYSYNPIEKGSIDNLMSRIIGKK